MSNHKRRSAAFVLAVIIIGGCGGYPTAASAETIELMTALRTACNTQNSERLDQVRRAIEQARAEMNLNEAEYDAFQRILAQADAGQWHEAERECVSYQRAQIQ